MHSMPALNGGCFFGALAVFSEGQAECALLTLALSYASLEA